MTKKPLVSICIPNYNNGTYLEKAITSALDQTWTEIEVIVCDNRSTDESIEVANAITDSRLQVYQNRRNLGMYGNFARCATYARGGFLKFLAADDWLAPDFLEVTLPYFEKYKHVALVGTRQAKVSDQGKILGYRNEPTEGKVLYSGEEMLEAFLRHTNPIGNPTRVIFRRQVFEELGGFDLNIGYCCDFDLWLRMINHYAVVAVPKVCSYERKHPLQNTKLYAKAAGDIRDVVIAYQKNFEAMPEFWSRSRRVELTRYGLRSFVLLGMKRALVGDPYYFKDAATYISTLAPIHSWLPWHLVFTLPAAIMQRGISFGVRLYKKPN